MVMRHAAVLTHVHMVRHARVRDRLSATAGHRYCPGYYLADGAPHGKGGGRRGRTQYAVSAAAGGGASRMDIYRYASNEAGCGAGIVERGGSAVAGRVRAALTCSRVSARRSSRAYSLA